MTANKQVTREAVRFAATTLILAEGQTSVLAVQLYLRRQGYEVYAGGRDNICRYLDLIAFQEDWWIITANGGWKTYSFETLELHAT